MPIPYTMSHHRDDWGMLATGSTHAQEGTSKTLKNRELLERQPVTERLQGSRRDVVCITRGAVSQRADLRNQAAPL
jgi:hypothetical protein